MALTESILVCLGACFFMGIFIWILDVWGAVDDNDHKLHDWIMRRLKWPNVVFNVFWLLPACALLGLVMILAVTVAIIPIFVFAGAGSCTDLD